MINIFLRTIILYVIIVVLMRFTGKRQIGQLELTELVTAFMISELAASPISDNSIPLLYGIIPMITLICLEVFLSYASLKSLFFRKMIAGSSLALVCKGKIDKNQMNKARITVEELTSAMRGQGILSMSEVEYAFLESSGTISIIPKAKHSPPSAKDLNIEVSEKKLEHSLIIDGKINHKELKIMNKSEDWLLKKLKEHKVNSVKEVFYFCISEDGQAYLMRNKKEDDK